MADNHDEAITQLSGLTGASAELATQYLTATDWNLETAAAAFFADTEEESHAVTRPAASATSTTAATAAQPEYTGPRTLDGRPAPQAAAAATPRTQAKKKGIATLGSLAGHASHDDHHDDDHDDDEDDDHGRGDLFAGGEKSGLAVQDPNAESGGTKRIINDIVKKARANATRPESDVPAGPSRSNQFRGTGQTLGGDGVASRSIPDPSVQAGVPAAPPANEEPQSRTLHLWRDGFSVDDGPLHRFDDPQNAADLALIREGRAPLHLMGVRYDQPVDVKLEQHDENWRQLPRIYRPFGGVGRRLGSPLPGDGSSAEASASIDAIAAAARASTAAASGGSGSSATTGAGAAVTVDESQPRLTIRVQLPNGTRLPARFNTTHTIGDVYRVIKQASPETGSRAWVLATTFPNKDHTDHSLVLGELAEFRKGGTAVVKWT